jgi:RimJ/RimL family protein N-acetyltransferase
MFLETQRLILRTFQESDLETFLAYRNDPAVAELQGWNLPYTREQAQTFIEEMKAMPEPSSGEWLQLAMQLKPLDLPGHDLEDSSQIVIGDIAFKLTKDQRQAEMGITLASSFQGNGYAQEAGARLLQFLFDDLALHRVYANTDPDNFSAQVLLEKLGFRREAHFIENLWHRGRWWSEYWYAILHSEWISNNVDPGNL